MRLLKLATTRAGLIGLLDDLIAARGTDVHLKVPGRPFFRVEDSLVATRYDALGQEDLQNLARAVLDLAQEEVRLIDVRDLHIAFGVEDRGRFRAQISRQRGSLAIVIHRIATESPTLMGLNLDGELSALLESGAGGLLLVGGPRQRYGVMAAMVHHYKTMVFGHLVTIEDPVEFLHRDGRASVTQREVGQDVVGFWQGLTAALRQDPDALFVSDVPEARDAEMVLRAAEEGLLVVAGLPTLDGAGAVRSFVRRFPAGRDEEVSQRVAAVLRGTVSVPRVGAARFVSTAEAAPQENERPTLIARAG